VGDDEEEDEEECVDHGDKGGTESEGGASDSGKSVSKSVDLVTLAVATPFKWTRREDQLISVQHARVSPPGMWLCVIPG
jgi:hypothetical protein